MTCGEVWLAVLDGLCYSVAYLFLCSALRLRGVAVPMAILRLAVLIPVACSILIWGEHPNPLQIWGIACSLIALPLLGLDGADGKGGLDRRTLWQTALLFILSGGCQLAVKVFHEESPLRERSSFFFILFVTASLVAAIAWSLRSRRLLAEGCPLWRPARPLQRLQL